MKAIKLNASVRQVPTAEKNQTRKQGRVPAEVYGQTEENIHLFVEKKDLDKIYRKAEESNLIDLEVDGADPITVLIKDIQRDPVTDEIIHLDFYKIKMGQELQTVVPLVFVGESKAVKELNGIFVKSLEEIEISCLPKDLISSIEVDINVLESFDVVIKVSDLKVPETIKILTDLEKNIATVVPVKVKEEPVETEIAEGEEGEEAKEEGEETSAGPGDAKEGEGKKESSSTEVPSSDKFSEGKSDDKKEK